MKHPEDISTTLPASLRLFSIQQVAEILQIRDNAVRRLIFDGKLAAKRVGVLVRVPQSALEEFLDQNPCTSPDRRRDPTRKGRA